MYGVYLSAVREFFQGVFVAVHLGNFLCLRFQTKRMTEFRPSEDPLIWSAAKRIEMRSPPPPISHIDDSSNDTIISDTYDSIVILSHEHTSNLNPAEHD